MMYSCSEPRGWKWKDRTAHCSSLKMASGMEVLLNGVELRVMLPGVPPGRGAGRLNRIL